MQNSRTSLMKTHRSLLETIISVAGICGVLFAPMAAYPQFVLNPVLGMSSGHAGSVAWGDYDNDGQLDFVLTGAFERSRTTSLWRNTGSGFSNVTAIVAPGLPGFDHTSVAWGDYDNDGRLDLFLTGQTNELGAGASQLWRNTGAGFTNVPIPGLLGVIAGSVAWSDYDGDGRLDFLMTGLTNGFGGGLISQLWRNTGSGFTNVPVPGLPGVWLGSLAWGDYNNDGRPDFLLSGITKSAGTDSMCQLWRNTGNGFTNLPLPGVRGVSFSSIGWADFNNDGLLDF